MSSQAHEIEGFEAGAAPRVCLIGAGSSGIAAAKALYERGIDFDCFEKSDRIGGNWVFENKNGMSAAYRDLFINTSRPRMEYSDFPMPESYPDFPHHTQIAAYFEEYVDHFGFRERITFETGVERADARGGRQLEDRARHRREPQLRRADRGQRPSLEPPLARTDVSRRGHIHGRAAARALLHRQLDLRRQARGGARAWATLRWTSPSSPPTSPSAPTSRLARACGSSPSTCSANRSTSCATTRAYPSSSASGSSSS